MDDPAFAYAGSRNALDIQGAYGNGEHESAARSSTATIRFQGTGIQVLGTRSPNHGIATFSLDGGAPQRVDLYSADWRSHLVLFSRQGLTQGSHTLVVTVLGERSVASGGTQVWLDRAVVTSADAPAPSPSPTPTPSPTPSPAPSPAPSSVRPFAASSSWNTPLASTARYTSVPWPASTGWNYGANWENYAPAVHRSTAADPVVDVQLPSDSWGYPAGTYQVRIPRGVTGAAGTDGELLVVDGSTVWNFWQFQRTSDTTAKVSALGKADIATGSGWGTKQPFRSAGITAAGSSEMAGLVMRSETDAGEIEHALQLVVHYQWNVPTPVGEAISADGSGTDGQPGVVLHEGQRLAIPKTTALPSGLSPLGQKVARALQKYGAFDIDQAGGLTGLRVQQNAYDAATVNALRADMGKLVPLLQKVG